MSARYMDFKPKPAASSVSEKPSRVETPVRKSPVAVPVRRLPNAKSVAPRMASVASPTRKPSVAKPKSPKPTPAQRPASRSRVTERAPVSRVSAQAQVRRSAPQAKPQLRREEEPLPEIGVVDFDSFGEIAEFDEEQLLGVIEDLEEPTESGAQVEQPSAVPVREDGIAKDNRIGFVAGKSPFINVEKLEKRPLSALRRDKPVPQKNTYADQAKAAAAQSDVPTMVVTGASKGSNFSLLVAILLTMILGGVVGFVVYLAFFQ